MPKIEFRFDLAAILLASVLTGSEYPRQVPAVCQAASLATEEKRLQPTAAGRRFARRRPWRQERLGRPATGGGCARERHLFARAAELAAAAITDTASEGPGREPGPSTPNRGNDMPILGLARRLLLAGSALVLLSAAADAQVRYIASTGKDANNCASPATPCRTLPRGITTTPAGGELRIL